MTITKEYIENLRNNTFMNISIKQEKEILDMFSSELENGHKWSMQDIHTNKLGKSLIDMEYDCVCWSPRGGSNIPNNYS